MKFSIIINTWERPTLLSRCLAAVSRQKTLEDAEVIVVDDGGTGDLKAIERSWKRKFDLRMIRIAHSGWSVARNRGVAAAGGERVLFLGDDVMVRPGWLAAHRAAAETRPANQRAGLAVLGPYPLKENPAMPPALRRRADPVRWCDMPTETDNPGFRFFMTGNLSMDRERFLALGGFDDRFTRYGWEDIDLGYRFTREGGELVFDRAASAEHDHPPITRRELWRREFDRGYGAWQISEKWPGEDFDFVRFWRSCGRAGPAWRRAAGDRMIALLERAAPESRRIDPLYERMIFSHRLAGAEAARRES